ncbi:MAG: glycosyltransferase [Candidatus Nanoarchaeia archaeon]|nr:glycosyltransferase [Candidatus Nanoarchaeia archaeon]
MIHIIIASYNEPKSTEKAVNAFLNQNIPKPFEIIVSDPFPEVEEYLVDKFSKKIRFFQDPDEGKSFALNMILEEIYSENKNDIIIFTDGDVYISENAVKEILDKFKNPEIGLVCGHPVSLNSRNEKYGYYSHLFFDEMNLTRKKLSEKKEFFEVSGYLFAIRNGIIKNFPVESSEDNIIPILLWNKGYKLSYAEEAKVYVLNPQNEKDWLTQKKRNIKGHLALEKLVDKIPKRKNTFLQEAFRGFKIMFRHPKNFKEFFWLINSAFLRLKAWKLAKKDLKKGKEYKDGWRGYEGTTDSTKPLD